MPGMTQPVAPIAMNPTGPTPAMPGIAPATTNPLFPNSAPAAPSVSLFPPAAQPGSITTNPLFQSATPMQPTASGATATNPLFPSATTAQTPSMTPGFPQPATGLTHT